MPLTTSYRTLLKKVREAIAKGRFRVEQTKVQTYWNIGKIIQKDILKNRGRGNYGERVVLRLALDLKIHRSTLYQSVQFYTQNRKFDARRQLSWTHYKRLLPIQNSVIRNSLAKDAARHDWKTRTLAEEIERRTRRSERRRQGRNVKTLKRLLPKKGKLGVYQIVKWNGKRVIDLGFANYLETRKKPGKKVNKKQLYTYEAQVERVVDGDTVWAKIHLGYGVWTRQKLRLRGIDTPELGSPAGKRAKRFLERAIKNTQPRSKAKEIRRRKNPGVSPASSSFSLTSRVTLTTTKTSDKYDRYLVDLFAGDVFLNQSLLDAGHARLL